MVRAWVTTRVMVGVRVSMVNIKVRVRMGLGLEQTTLAPFLTV